MDQIKSCWLIGIDGGGFGCRVAVATPDGKVIAKSRGGPANFTTDPDGTIANVRAAIEQAAQIAGLSGTDLSDCVAHAGIAGVQRPADAQIASNALPFRTCKVTEDRVTAITGALGDDDGVLVSVGTGSFVGVKHGDATRFFGGWGMHLSDQASGAWLGRRLLQIVLQVHDGLYETSDLCANVLGEFQNDPIEIVTFAKQATPADYAAFAPPIIAAAESDDPHASRLMQEGADFLQECMNISDEDQSMRTCLSGGLGPHYRRFFDVRRRELLHPARGTALDGALELARKSFSNGGLIS